MLSSPVHCSRLNDISRLEGRIVVLLREKLEERFQAYSYTVAPDGTITIGLALRAATVFPKYAHLSSFPLHIRNEVWKSVLQDAIAVIRPGHGVRKGGGGANGSDLLSNSVQVA